MAPLVILLLEPTLNLRVESQSPAAAAAVRFARAPTLSTRIGIMPVSPLYPLARLQSARAAVLSNDRPAAKKAHEEFLASWKDADPGIDRIVITPHVINR